MGGGRAESKDGGGDAAGGQSKLVKDILSRQAEQQQVCLCLLSTYCSLYNSLLLYTVAG